MKKTVRSQGGRMELVKLIVPVNRLHVQSRSYETQHWPFSNREVGYILFIALGEALAYVTISLKNRLNVDSPSFTPTLPETNGTSSLPNSTISPKAVKAAPFTPKLANLGKSKLRLAETPRSEGTTGCLVHCGRPS